MIAAISMIRRRADIGLDQFQSSTGSIRTA